MSKHWYKDPLADRFEPVMTEKSRFYVEMRIGSGKWETVADGDSEEELSEYCSNGINFRIRCEVIETIETTRLTYRDL